MASGLRLSAGKAVALATTLRLPGFMRRELTLAPGVAQQSKCKKIPHSLGEAGFFVA